MPIKKSLLRHGKTALPAGIDRWSVWKISGRPADLPTRSHNAYSQDTGRAPHHKEVTAWATMLTHRIPETHRFSIGQTDGIAAGRLVGRGPGQVTRCQVDTIIGHRGSAYCITSGSHSRWGLIRNSASAFGVYSASGSNMRVVTRPTSVSSPGRT